MKSFLAVQFFVSLASAITINLYGYNGCEATRGNWWFQCTVTAETPSFCCYTGYLKLPPMASAKLVDAGGSVASLHHSVCCLLMAFDI